MKLYSGAAASLLAIQGGLFASAYPNFYTKCQAELGEYFMGDQVIESPNGAECHLTIRESTVQTAAEESNLTTEDVKSSKLVDRSYKIGAHYRISVNNFEGGGLILSTNSGVIDGGNKHGRRCPSSRSYYNPGQQEDNGNNDVAFHWVAPYSGENAIIIVTCSAYYGGPNHQKTVNLVASDSKDL